MKAREGQIKVQINLSELTEEELAQKMRTLDQLILVAALRRSGRIKEAEDHRQEYPQESG